MTNVIKAIAQFLDNPENLETVLGHARIVGNKNSTQKEVSESTKALQDMFRHSLKVHLPMYYDKNGDKRSAEDIKEYHLQERWDLDSKHLQNNPESVLKIRN
jgi:hypothetical protein